MIGSIYFTQILYLKFFVLHILYQTAVKLLKQNYSVLFKQRDRPQGLPDNKVFAFVM